MAVRLQTGLARSGNAVGRALVAALFVLAEGVLTPAVASAQAQPPAARGELAQLQSECAHLRAELDRANADVASLKRADRGFRNDYRLRQRLADAEALARKLTEAESRLHSRTATSLTPRPALLAPPVMTPTDGPVELEAKADLLTDQAKRLAAEADTLSGRAGQLRDRQMLRRRSLQLERDPFVGVETSKRNMVFGAPRTSADSAKGVGTVGGGGSTAGNEGAPTDRGTTTGTPVTTATAPGSMTGAAPAPTSPTASGGTANSSGATAPPQSAPPSLVGTPTSSGTPAPPPTTAVSNQIRTLLDPATLLQLQRLERSGKPLSDADALDKAAAALRQRSQALDAQAKSLRARSGR